MEKCSCICSVFGAVAFMLGMGSRYGIYAPFYSHVSLDGLTEMLSVPTREILSSRFITLRIR